MKFWLPGLALLAVTGAVQAENYRIVQSPSQKLDVWIDDVKDNTPQSWCAKELPLRIVANGDKNASILDNFVPRLGALLNNQCATLQQINWKLVDADNTQIARGTAEKSGDWAVSVTPETEQPPVATFALIPPAERPEAASPLADRSPWQELTLQGGCHLRTFWRDGAGAPAMFIPQTDANSCKKGGWLSGRNTLIQSSGGVEKPLAVTFVYGFPVMGLNESVDPNKLLITSVNNERMVVSTANAAQSWMILPYIAAANSWEMDGTLAVEVSRELASDETRLKARIDEVSKVWAPWLAPGAQLNIVLIDSLRPLLRNPAVGTYRPAH